MQTYEVKPLPERPCIDVTVPGSKSMTNRALLLASLAEGRSVLHGVLFSEDSRVFLQALRDLGFSLEIDEKKRSVVIDGVGGRIPRSQANIYVGSAGTAARFLTAMTAMADGCFRLDASAQMKKRPMAALLDALRQLGATIECLCEEGTFPIRITGIGRRCAKGEVAINIDQSSQFLSALLMAGPSRFDDLKIRLTGTRSALSYVRMTEQMMKQFGHAGVSQEADGCYRVTGSVYQAQEYTIEPDVSAACYFYAMAAVTGGDAHVRHMKADSLQGDWEMLHVLERMGCVLSWKEGALWMKGPAPGNLQGIDVDMSDFSDQALTLAAIAPYANGQVHIRNVGHIRGQECDRLHAMQENLTRMGISCQEETDGIRITPGMPRAAEIETYQDHRVAMAFAVTGVRTEGIVIRNPMCCRKTFAEYFEILDQLTERRG